MNWQTLFSAQRTGEQNPSKVPNPDQIRNSFQRDYDRIIFASAFRRLQNKTQVFPLPGAVFVHNRLTHSLEVASVGRSLGKAAGDAIASRYPDSGEGFREFYRYELPSVIAAACLAHDIGNPPFGHSGEDAIRTFFREAEGVLGTTLREELTENQRLDFEKFEGNANAFRTLSHHFNETEPGGYMLTYTTLASIVKYPCDSVSGFDRRSGKIATKKSGFFDTEKQQWASIASVLGIPVIGKDQFIYARHPFVYLTEAADDICYRIIDMEDAHRLRIVSYETVCDLFLPFFESGSGYNGISYIRSKLDRIQDMNQKVQYIRARWIGLMISRITEAFLEQEEALLSGNLEQDLLSCLPESDRKRISNINEFSVKHIYNHRSVVEIELAGYHVIGNLLREFVEAVLHPDTPRSEKLLKLVPEQFPLRKISGSKYADIQSVVDFISGMTDLYAIELYRKITGIHQLPHG